MQAFRLALINFLRTQAVTLALKKILGTAVGGGFKVWLVKYVTTNLFDEVAVPIIKFASRKGLLFYDKAEGAIKVKKINEAKKDGDADAYSSTIGSV